MSIETRDKKSLSDAYKKANSTLPKELPYITFEEAKRASRLLASKFGKLKDASPSRFFPMSKKRYVRKVWICLSGNPSTLHRGWRRLIHDMAHDIFTFRNPKLPDHCTFQADLEAEVCEYVLKSGWLNGSLKPKLKPKLSNDEKKVIKIKKFENIILRWETKIKRANTYLKKYKAKLKRLKK
jgi:hypothetical protein